MGYAAINALGLIAGIGCAALVAVFLQYEWSYDAHHDDADRIHRITRDYRSSTYSTLPFENYRRADGAEQRSLAEALPQDVPEIEQATNFEIFRNESYVETASDRRFTTDRYVLTNTGPAFVDLFTFERVAGAPLHEALAAPYSALLTESSARTYFGDANPVGQTIRLDSLDLEVTAVVADPPPNTRIRFDVAAQVKRIPNWGAFHYVRLAAGADPEAVAPKVSDVMDRVNPARVQNDYVRTNQKGETLQALTDIHLGPRLLYDDTAHRDVRYLYAFALAALLILGITAINYANLSIALYAERTTEIGVRKALGARRGQVTRQFLVEAILLATACVPLGLGAAAAVVPAFNRLMNLQLAVGALVQLEVVAGMIALAVVTGAVSGGYPAWLLARREAVDLFERGLGRSGFSGRAGSPWRGWSLRHGLIVVQFGVLIGLGGLSYVVHDQLRYVQSEEIGLRTDAVVSLGGIAGDSTLYQNVRQRLLEASAVQSVGTGPVPGPAGNRVNYKAEGADVAYEDGFTSYVDVGWFDVNGIESPVVDAMKAEGPSAPERMLINEAAADRLGWSDPAGRTLVIDPNAAEPLRFAVAGVVPNVHLQSMREEVRPRFYTVRTVPGWAFNALVQFKPGRTQDGMRVLREVWTDLRPDVPFQATFVDDSLRELYDQERRFARLALFLTGLAMLLAVLGLAGLTAYLTRLRMKEISIRKVLGASTPSLLVLLNREFVVLVGVALVVGTPLAWWAAESWLSGFAYRIAVPLWIFPLAGGAALVVALAAASIQSLRAAQADPARILRAD